MRSPTAAFATALAKPHLDDVVFAELQFASGSSFVCSREHDIAWNGQDWLGRGRVGSIEMVGEGHALEARGIAMSLSGLPGGMLATALNPAEYKNRPAKLWYGLLEPDMIDFDFTQGTLAAQVGAALASITFTRAGATATRVNEQGLIETVAADTPRYDYDPVTLELNGLLIEGARTNAVQRSAELDNAYWSKLNATVTANAATAPDGTLTADKVIADTTNAQHGVHRTITGLTIGQPYTTSFFAKAGEYPWLFMTEGNNVTAQANFNLATGQLGTVTGTGSPSATITPMRDGWYRCSLTYTPIATSANIQARPQIANGGGNYAGDDASGIYVWGADFQTGAFNTSHIPTTSAAVTRNADRPDFAGVSWANAVEGTMVLEGDQIALTGTNIGAYLGGTVGTDQIDLRVSSGGAYQLVNAGGVNSANPFAGGITADTVFRLAAVYKADDFAVSLDGAAPATDSGGAVPAAITVGYLGHHNGTNQWNGHLRRFTYFPKRLGNAALVRLSAGGDPAAEAVGRRLVADPVGPFLYRMDSLEFELGEQASVRLTAESRLADWDRPRVRRYNDADQQNEYPGDKFFEYAERMVEWQETW